MKRRHYLVSLLIDVFAYLALTLITMNFITLIVSSIYTHKNIVLTDDHFIVQIFGYIEILVYIGYLYFYFIFVPYKNKQGTLGDTLTNIKLTKENGDITKLFLFKRLILAFVGNSLLLISFIYMFFKKSNKQTLHDNLLKSKYEHVMVKKELSIKKNKKIKKTK